MLTSKTDREIPSKEQGRKTCEPSRPSVRARPSLWDREGHVRAIKRLVVGVRKGDLDLMQPRREANDYQRLSAGVGSTFSTGRRGSAADDPDRPPAEPHAYLISVCAGARLAAGSTGPAHRGQTGCSERRIRRCSAPSPCTGPNFRRRRSCDRRDRRCCF